jgi:hypothetical protein
MELIMPDLDDGHGEGWRHVETTELVDRYRGSQIAEI